MDLYEKWMSMLISAVGLFANIVAGLGNTERSHISKDF